MGFTQLVTAPANAIKQRAAATLRLSVVSDGARRVLRIMDTSQYADSTLAGSSLQSLSPAPAFSEWSRTLKAAFRAMGQRDAWASDAEGNSGGGGPATGSGDRVDLQLRLAGIGMSLVHSDAELLYGRLAGLHAHAVSNPVAHMLELAVARMQVSNSGFALDLQRRLVGTAGACGGRGAVWARGRAPRCQQHCGAHTEAEPTWGATSLSGCCKHERPIQVCFLHSAGEGFLQTTAAVHCVVNCACMTGSLW